MIPTDARSRVRIIITLRVDFYDRPLHYPEFGELVRNRIETILPLSAKGLERAIARPAERVRVVFEQGLVASIVSDLNILSIQPTSAQRFYWKRAKSMLCVIGPP